MADDNSLFAAAGGRLEAAAAAAEVSDDTLERGIRWTAEEVADRLKERMVTESEAIWDLAQDRDVALRTAAYAHALQRISDAVDATGSAEDFREPASAAEA